MSKWPASWRVNFSLILCGVWCGCLPIAETPVDEEKDPNYIEGKNHRNAMDYKSAIDAFERAIQSNPRNAAAHFELGLLYDEKMRDFVAALYHYQKHIQIRPESSYKDTVAAKLSACKTEISKSVAFGVVSADVQRDFIRLTNEIGFWRQQNNALKAQLAAKPAVLTQWMTLRVTNIQYLTQRVAVAVPAPAPSTSQVARAPAPAPPGPLAKTNAPTPQAAPAQRAARVYRVQSGETMSEIARRHGIPLRKLQEANRSIDARQLRPGQTLTIP